MQISLVILFVSITDLKIQDTRIFLLDELLENMLFNCLFVSFCILILINGSNFIDGLNTLNIGYYLIDWFSNILSKISRFRNLS